LDKNFSLEFYPAISEILEGGWEVLLSKSQQNPKTKIFLKKFCSFHFFLIKCLESFENFPRQQKREECSFARKRILLRMSKPKINSLNVQNLFSALKIKKVTSLNLSRFHFLFPHGSFKSLLQLFFAVQNLSSKGKMNVFSLKNRIFSLFPYKIVIKLIFSLSPISNNFLLAFDSFSKADLISLHDIFFLKLGKCLSPTL